MMGFSVSALLAGFFFGVIGFWLLKEGKKRGNLKIVVISVLMLTYTLFTSNPYADWGIGIALTIAAYIVWE